MGELFTVGDMAMFYYPDSVTNLPRLRIGIVERVTHQLVTLKFTDDDGKVTYKSFSYNKITFEDA